MATDRAPRSLEIVTAVMLGLVSVVTALGAWQSAVWTSLADEYSRDSGDARDVAVNQSVLAEYSRRTDTESSAEARRYAELSELTTDSLEALLYETRVATVLAGVTPGLVDAWIQWRASGFGADADPILDEDYVVAREGVPQSYAHTSAVLGAFSDDFQARSGILAQASLIQALALFLFGIAGVNRVRSVRVGVIALGFLVFLAGLGLASTAF